MPLVDAVGELGELAELFPETSDWAPYRELYPELFAESQLAAPVHVAISIRSAGTTTVLVDTGVGPAGGSGARTAESEEGLLPALAVRQASRRTRSTSSS